MSSLDELNLNQLLETIQKESVKIEKANTEAESNESMLDSTRNKENKTRSALTLFFLTGFFLLLILFAIFVWVYNGWVVSWVLELKKAGIENAVDYLKPLELEKVLSIIITALGTSLGFIIGYYFKEKK
ncbi:TPA: hypothetical protein ACS70J_000012 [Providencia alcalifaciens]